MPHAAARGYARAAVVELGAGLRSVVEAVAVRRTASPTGAFYGFRVLQADESWAACVQALQQGQTHADLAPRAVVAKPELVPAI